MPRARPAQRGLSPVASRCLSSLHRPPTLSLLPFLPACAHCGESTEGGGLLLCSSVTEEKREVNVFGHRGEIPLVLAGQYWRLFLQKVARFIASRFCEKKSLRGSEKSFKSRDKVAQLATLIQVRDATKFFLFYLQ